MSFGRAGKPQESASMLLMMISEIPKYQVSFKIIVLCVCVLNTGLYRIKIYTIIRQLLKPSVALSNISRRWRESENPNVVMQYLAQRRLKNGNSTVVLASIVETSNKTGLLPEDWKCANITAIYKKGNKKVAGNYRPISLTSIVCKLMETLVREEIIEHMKRNKLFSKKQFGFLSGRSTVLRLLQVLDKWA